MRRFAHTLLGALGVVLAVGGCTGAGDDNGLRASRSPRNAPESAEWYRYPAPNGTHTVVGVVRAQGVAVPPHVGVLLVPGSDGLSGDYISLAHELARSGLDVAAGCWFANEAVLPTEVRIACADAPKFQGVTAAAVADLDALVAAAYQALGPYEELALVGFSRGGGIAALRASTGTPEPVVTIAGMVAGTSAWGRAEGEVDVVARAGSIDAPVMVLHGQDDWLIPVAHAQALEDALRADAADVRAVYYPGQGHGLLQDPTTRADIVRQIAQFVCSRLGCVVPNER